MLKVLKSPSKQSSTLEVVSTTLLNCFADDHSVPYTTHGAGAVTFRMTRRTMMAKKPK